VARLEEDSTVRRLNQYDDWHRVERTREQFQREVTELRQQGWTVSPSDCR
jgi:DNA-binding IclR family transcriptional regulator